MPVVHQTTLQRKHLQAKPSTLFVYGDVMEGEPVLVARECRGEPNAVAIPCMRNGSFVPASYLKDADLEEVTPAIKEAFRRMAAHAEAGGEVCFPNNGIGHSIGGGLRLHAPAIDAYVTRCYRYLMTCDTKAARARGEAVDDPDARRQA